MRDRPFPPRHTTCATPGFTRAPSQPAQVQPTPPERKPHLFNKRIILWGAEKCCRNVTSVRNDRRARRAERVGRSFTRIGVRMQLRRSQTFHRTRERGTEGICVNWLANLPYIESTHPQIWKNIPIFAAPNPSPQIWIWAIRSGPSDRPI